MVNPVPYVWVGSRTFGVYTSPTNPQQVTPGTLDGRTVARSGTYSYGTMLDTLSIEWGRDDVWSQPDPSVATVTIWQSDKWIDANPTDNYLTAIATGKLTGERFVCHFPAGVVPSVRNANGAPYSWRFFEGRITNADAKRMTMPTDQGEESGWAIRVQGSDQVGALANAAVPPSPMANNQTMAARAAAIKTATLGAANIREIYFEAAYAAGKTREVDTKDKSGYDLVCDLYGSFGHQFAYNPHRNVLIRIPANYAHGSYTLQFGRRAAGDTVRLYAPRQIDNSGRQAPDDSDPYPSGYVGACDVQGDVVLSTEQAQRITQVQCKWWVAASSADYVSTLDVQTAPSPAVLRYDSWFNDGLQIDPILAAVKGKALAEGSRPCHPAIVWDTARAGDVPDWETFMSLTLPMQSVRMIVLAGSPFAAALGAPPVWYPCGGVIAYTGGKWTFTTNLAPAPLTLSGSPITFTALSGNGTGSTLTLGQLDHSISSYDLRYISDPALYTWN